MENLVIISPEEILQDSSSSGMGISYWRHHRGCSAILVHDAISKALRASVPAVPRIRLPLSKGEKINMMQVGIFFHKLRELWRLGKICFGAEDSPLLDAVTQEPVLIEWGGAFECDEWKEACRLFRFYTSKYSLSEWKTISCEEPFEFGCRVCAQQTPSGCNNISQEITIRKGRTPIVLCEIARNCIKEFGVPCISGRYDEVMQITQEQMEELIPSRMISLFESGVYIVDAKTKGQRNETVESEFENSMQFALYQHAWTLNHPEQPSKGCIADTVYAYKTAPRLESFLVVNTERRLRVLRDYLSKAWQAFVDKGFETNSDRCYDYHKTCKHLTSGACNLIDVPPMPVQLQAPPKVSPPSE